MKKSSVFRSLAVVCLVVGIGFLCYPKICELLYRKEAEDVIKDFEEIIEQSNAVSEDSNKEDKTQSSKTSGNEESTKATNKGNNSKKRVVDLVQLREAFEEYNKGLYESGQSELKDPFSYEQESFQLEEYGLEDDMVGYIEIPKMDIKLPIYLGANQESMKKGAGHLSQTSIPIGGTNTNAVLAAHRGYSQAPMFRNIQELELGDKIYITNFWEKLSYKVVKLEIIDPMDIRKVLIQESKDMVTLITCHPYMHNYQRYVVYCERIS